jgi:hypothetical protein
MIHVFFLYFDAAMVKAGVHNLPYDPVYDLDVKFGNTVPEESLPRPL